MEWLSIDTAPQDGSDILAFWQKRRINDDGDLTDEVIGHVMAVTFWSAGGWAEPDYLDAIGERFGDDCCYAPEPTYWMPLPQPPNGEVRGATSTAVLSGTTAERTDMATLEPCPFCGGEAAPTAHLEYSWFAPVCKACGVRGPSVLIDRGADPQRLRELMNKADDLWNARVPPNARHKPRAEGTSA